MIFCISLVLHDTKNRSAVHLIMGLAFGVFLYGLVRRVTREPLSDGIAVVVVVVAWSVSHQIGVRWPEVIALRSAVGQ